MFFAVAYGASMDLLDGQFAGDLAIAKHYGWTLDYVRSLDELEYLRILAIIDGQSRARSVAAWRANLPPLRR